MTQAVKITLHKINPFCKPLTLNFIVMQLKKEINRGFATMKIFAKLSVSFFDHLDGEAVQIISMNIMNEQVS